MVEDTSLSSHGSPQDGGIKEFDASAHPLEDSPFKINLHIQTVNPKQVKDRDEFIHEQKVMA